ncbi:MAG: LysR family transcriptional regulator [Sphingopyxis sp.]|jgi:DNA-binding transcriptional LysR family regulator|nr:LysR family transcriptional regulator [Sphingopyxis sp.]
MKQGLSIQRGSLDGVEAFLRVAERRSFTAAAHDLGVTPSAISQTIRALEQRVGVPLLMRTTRSVGLTEAGEVFRRQAAPAVDSLDAAFEAARTFGERPAGHLRLTMPRAAMPHFLDPQINLFFERYPDIELEINAEDRFVDVVAEGFDAGIRLSESLDADMVAIRLADPFRFVVVGTPEYFAAHGRPQTPADLRDHACVRIRLPQGGLMPWTFLQGNRTVEANVSGPLIVNDFLAQLAAARSGTSLAYMAEPNVAAAVALGELEMVLVDHSMSTGGLFLYYPSRRQVMPKLRALIDFLREHPPMATRRVAIV